MQRSLFDLNLPEPATDGTELVVPRPAPAPTYTRDTLPPVPEGKIRVADYGQVPREFYADTTLHGRALMTTAWARGQQAARMVELRHWTRGYVPAGSRARWDEEQWTVTWEEPDGSRHGQGYAGDDAAQQARLYFDKLTTEGGSNV